MVWNQKNPGVPRSLKIFPAKRLIEEPMTTQNFHSEKITANTDSNMEEEYPSFDLNFEFLEPDVKQESYSADQK